MRLSAHISQADPGEIIAHLARVARVLGLLFLVPAAVAVGFGELVQAAVLAAVSGGLLLGGWLGGRRRPRHISLTDGLVVTALAYLLATAAGTLVLLPEVAVADAVFESMSGFTTTGLTVIPPSRLTPSLVFFRAFSQWIGGAGIVVLTLVVLLRTNQPAHRLYLSEADESQRVGSVRSTTRAVLSVYLLLTVAAAALLTVTGAPWFSAVVHALTGVSTGGFTAGPEGLDSPSVVAVRLALVAIMLLGATSFPLLYRIRHEGLAVLLHDPQLRALVAGAVAAAVLMWLTTPGGDLLTSLFHGVSALTTTGFTVTDPAGWDATSRALATGLMVVGGSAGSTAGGVKLIRFLLLLRLGWWLVARTLLPREARLPLRHPRLVTSEAELLRIAGLAVMHLTVLALSAIALTVAGATVEDGLFEAASALGTVGLSVGVTGPELATWAKLLLAFDMWLGRLEIVPALVLLFPGTWRRLRWA